MRKTALLVGSFPILFIVGMAHGAPVVVSEGVAEPLAVQGTGLCEASAITMNPTADLGLLSPSSFSESVNGFLEAHQADRTQRTLQTTFDLSNNNASGTKLSYGDFIDAAAPTCKTGGCDFSWNDVATAFASRFRGYFNVTADLANKPIHFGIYTDDAAGIVIYDKNLAPHPIVTRPPELGIPAWRVTNEVTFMKPGLYPIEVLYVEITEHAALEMSYFVGSFEDFERPANAPPIVNLSDAGFTLFTPSAFFQTLTGAPPFPDVAACQQCDRAKVNQTGNNGCAEERYCNEAAVCAPCDNARYCGASCAPCGGGTPFCMEVNGNHQCVACRTDADCSNGGTCQSMTGTCIDGGAGGNGGTGGSGGSGGGMAPPSEGGCACRAVSSSSPTGMPVMIGLAFATVGLTRRRQRRNRTSR